MGKTSTTSKNKYNKLNYDRILLILPKGQKSILQAISKTKGISLNKFIIESINQKLLEDG